MEIDHEVAWLELKQVVLSKRSHGQDGLLRAMAEIELKCAVPEDQRGFTDAPRIRKAPTGRSRTTAGHA